MASSETLQGPPAASPALSLWRKARIRLGWGQVNVELIYSRRYSLELSGVAADPLRGERILAFLTAAGLTSPRRLHAPPPATYRQLRRVHTDDYMASLSQPGALLPILGLELADP
ncbi:MAG TPA: hypothetical protein VMM92_13840, partial [Thermoanaerobaculia bacterium]|nr:hypothetical protein [Thermoanaerobaculia bacterium]